MFVNLNQRMREFIMLGTTLCLSNVVHAAHPSLLDRLFGFDQSVSTPPSAAAFTLATAVNSNSPPAPVPIRVDWPVHSTHDRALYSQSLVAAQSHLERGNSLLAQNHPAAECEFIRALVCVAELRDVEQHSQLCSQSLANGITALWEAEELYRTLATTDVETALQVAQQFTTPVGRAIQSGRLAAAEANDTYLAYARQSIVVAVGKHQIAWQALYGLGQTYALVGGQVDLLASHSQEKAEALLLAAKAVQVERPRRTSPPSACSREDSERAFFDGSRKTTGGHTRPEGRAGCDAHS